MLRLLRNLIRELDHEMTHNNSYRDFHAPGVDYVCLFRSPQFTFKLYFLPPTADFIVSPHNHAYSFDTYLLSGRLSNYFLSKDRTGRKMGRFYKRSYTSPLNGGDGFSDSYIATDLYERQTVVLDEPLAHYYCNWVDVHSLIVHEPSIVFISQYADKLYQTETYFNTIHPPDTTNLYKRFEKGEIDILLDDVLMIMENIEVSRERKQGGRCCGSLGLSEPDFIQPFGPALQKKGL